MLNPWGRRVPDLSGVELNLEQKTWIANRVINGLESARQLSDKYNIRVKTIYKWVRLIKNGITLSPYGRPPIIAQEHLPKIKQFVDNHISGVPSAILNDEINKYAIATAQARRNISEAQVKCPSRRTLGTIHKQLKIKNGNAELTTNARAIACSDVRNAVSMCAAQHLMVPLVDHFLILNMDATQYTVGNSCSSTAKVNFTIRPSSGKSLQVTKDKKNSGITSYFIKHYLLISAGGIAADPVYIIADENMTKEDIDVHTVSGLGHGVGIENKGYVVFAKTRCVNVKFYEWYNTAVLVQFIINIKAHRNLSNDSVAWFQLDGEAVQIECYKSPAVLKILSDQHVVVGKSAASTTQITQPCDIGDCFKATKNMIKHTSDSDVAMDTHMLGQLSTVYANHMTKTAGLKMSANHIKMGKNGLLRVHQASKAAVSSKTVKESFSRAGVYNHNTASYDLSKILSNCTTKISIDEESEIIAVVPKLASILNKNGELKDSDFDKYNIRENEAIGSKDNLVLNRKRTILLTNAALVQKEEVKRLQKVQDNLLCMEKKRVRKVKADATKAAKAARFNSQMMRGRESDSEDEEE